MDFHGLARRQLQALCKINKIPANMTNVAMADALSALDIVEGIEEIMQAKTPEKAEAGSPEAPRTVTRTSTRARKPPVIVLESGGLVPRSRSRTSRKLVGGDTVEDDKKDLTKTPAVASSRKRAPGAASRKKEEVTSVQKVYSTRRSVRLVEKQLSELCLEDSTKRTQPIKIDNELSSVPTESGIKGDDFKTYISDKNAEEKVVSDEVNSSEISAQLLEKLDAACEVYGNEVSINVVTGATASETAEKDIYEACAEEVNGNEVSINVVTGATASETVEKDIYEACVEEAMGGIGTVEKMDAACEVNGNEVSINVVTGAAAYEACAEEAMGGIGNADADKEFEIVGHCVPIVNPIEVVAQPVETEDLACENHGVLVSGNGGTDANTSDKNAEEKLVSDEVNSSEISAQLLDKLDAACEDNGNEVTVNVVTGATASETVEKDIYEACAEEAMGGIGNADAEKEFEIHCVPNVNPIEVVAQPVEIEYAACENHGVLVSGNGGTDATTSENMEKEISETCAVLDIADAEKDLEIVGDGEVVETVTAEEIVTSQMDSDVVSDILVQGEVALQFSADLEKEISSDFVFDSVTIGEASFKTLAGHEKFETSANQMMKTDTEAYKHETETGILSSKEDATIEDLASLSQLAVAKEENDTTSQSDECDHDADSMTCQMGSPFHLSGHIEDLTGDFKPHNSVMSTVNYVDQMENVELCENNEEVLGSTDLKSVKVEMKLDAEKPVSEETTDLPLDASLKSKTDTDPEVQHLQQQFAIKEPLGLNKENTGNILMSEECIRATSYQGMSIRRLQKMLKEMNINTNGNGNKEKEANATKEIYKHQNTPRPRHALQALQGNTQN